MNEGYAAIRRFIAFWDQLPLERGPYVHPGDAVYISAGEPGPTQLQLDVVPIPVNGCLGTADIILLEANPNFDSVQEATWAMTDPEGALRLQEIRQRNLRQQHVPDDCPFYDLDPRLAASAGAAYWRSGTKFRDAAAALQRAWGLSQDGVFRELSWRVAVLQMLPYRSKKFNHTRVAERCASGQEVRRLIQSLIQDTDKLIVCQRRVEQWGFSFPSDRPNLITYDPKREALKASLSLNSRGGPNMIEKLASTPPRYIR